ncbi:DNA translocase FtsK [Acetobacter orientalis]|uniref:DNA translocase FtsK n=1 Tax=Acetobacter orientalis TaxID=146474 RepID=A0A2Z5ZDT7_9PROT|nr:DNA translocase FtsK [Acetobacter orientalis]
MARFSLWVVKFHNKKTGYYGGSMTLQTAHFTGLTLVE